VVIATRLFSPEVSAASFRLRALAESLARAGAQVTVVTTRPPRRHATEVEASEYRVSRFPVLRDHSGHVRGYFQYLSFDVPLFFRLLFSRSDLVIAEPPPTTGLVVRMTSWLRRRRYAYYAADVWSDAAESTSAPRLVVTVLRGVERGVLRHAAEVLAVSEEVAARAQELGARRVVTVGNGVDTELFTPDGSRPEESAPYFMYAGTMSEWQGAEIFVQALPRVLAFDSEIRLHLFGGGSKVDALKELANELGTDRIRFHGMIEPEQVARWLRGSVASLVSITPGQGYDFAKPTKIYAAAACGTPVIFAGAGAGAEVVRLNSLGTTAAHTPDAVASAMIAELKAHKSGATERARAVRAGWARDNASLDAAGARAAQALMSINLGQRKGRRE
jgi:glycosyltransferase involved in cell wall biosynthesis